MRKLFSILIQLYLFVSCNFLPFGEDRWGCLFAQLPTEEWVARIPGPNSDIVGPYFAVDKQGNSYVAGTHVVNDTINILCVKYKSTGSQLWYTLYKYPGYGYFAPWSIALDSSGNAYIVADFALNSSTARNALIVKLNGSTGSPEWAKTYVGQYGRSSFEDIKIDRLNNIFTIGRSDSSYLAVRYNTNGDSLWSRKYRPAGTAIDVSACTIDDSVNIVFTGMRRFFYPPFGYYDSLLVVKYSQGGVLRWESVYAYDILVNVGTKITADQNGSVYIGGVTRISGLGVYLTLKYDRNGVQQWAKIYDAPGGGGDNSLKAISLDRVNNSLYVTGAANANGIQVAATIKYNIFSGDSIFVKQDTGLYNRAASRDIIIDTIGNIYITGETYNSPSYLPYDIYTAKYSPSGSIIWKMTYNGNFNGIDIGKAIGLDGSNNVYVLGTSPSSTQVYDYVIIKYSQLTGVKTFSSESPSIYKLEQNYPNPFNPSTNIIFTVGKRSFIIVKIFDVLGRIKEELIKKELSPSNYEITFNGTGYSSGIYFYQLIADNIIIGTKKFIIVK